MDNVKKEYVIKLTDAEREILINSLRGMYDGTLIKRIVLELLEQNVAEQPSGKAGDCKSLIRRFDSDLRVHFKLDA